MRDIIKNIIKWWDFSTIKWYINPYYWIFPYFISFIEEGIYNPEYMGYVGGRVEIWTQWSQYDIDEYRFLTKDTDGYYKFREKYDFKNLSWVGLKLLKYRVNKYYYERQKQN